MEGTLQDRSEQIVAHLKECPAKKRSFPEDLFALFISAGLVAFLGLFKDSLTNVVILVIVIFAHELGHLIGMVFLGYKDARILFLPLMGAVTLGREINASSAHRALIAFSGPVSGILIGIILWGFYFQARDPVLLFAARMFLFLNLFNLLPLYPFDGGGIVESLFFTRLPILELVFRILGIAGLAWFAVVTKSWFAGILAYGFLLLVVTTFSVTLITQKLKNIFSEHSFPEGQNIPPAEFIQEALVLLESSYLLWGIKFDTKARLIQIMWDRVRIQPPLALMTAGLFVLYVGFWFMGATALYLFEKMSL